MNDRKTFTRTQGYFPEDVTPEPVGPFTSIGGVILDDQGQPVTPQLAKERLKFDVTHPKIVKIVSRMMNALTPDSGCAIVMLVAPPGAGKSHAARAVHRKVHSAARSSAAWTEDSVPAILLKIGDEGKSDFDFRSVYSEICEAGHAPPIPHRGAPRLPHAEVDTGRGAPFRQRRAAQKAIHDRKTQIVMLDEAAHILNAKSNETLLRHAKAVKTLADDSTAVLSLICSYDGLPLLKIDSQLRRRIKLVHFERYRDDLDEDKRHYRSAVLSISEALALDRAEIGDRIPLLMERTVGCIGATFDVFKRAIGDGWVDGKFDYEELDNNIPSLDYRDDVRRETLAAELSLKHL